MKEHTTPKPEKADRQLDIQGEVCPYTFVRTKLTLDEMENGQVLRVIVDYLPAVSNVPKSVAIEGNQVLEVKQLNEKAWSILIRKNVLPEDSP